MGQLVLALVACSLALCVSCARKPDPNTVVVVIESSPTNLDPRVGIDAQSERIDDLLFDSLVRRDEHFELKPWLAERWEIPDPQTYVFHLHQGVKFHDGQAAHLARCEVDAGFAADGQDSQFEGGDVRQDCEHRGAGCGDARSST